MDQPILHLHMFRSLLCTTLFLISSLIVQRALILTSYITYMCSIFEPLLSSPCVPTDMQLNHGRVLYTYCLPRGNEIERALVMPQRPIGRKNISNHERLSDVHTQRYSCVMGRLTYLCAIVYLADHAYRRPARPIPHQFLEWQPLGTWHHRLKENLY